MFLRSAAIFLLAAAPLASCDSPTSTAGRENVGTSETVRGELAANEADDRLGLILPEGDFRLLLQARSGSAADTLVAEIVDRQAVIARVTSVGTDTELIGQASPWVTPVAGARWEVRVRRSSGTGGGEYDVRLFARSSSPETAGADIVLGQTVESERLDVGGDVDEFRLAGKAGQEVVAFVQPATGSNSLTAELLDSASRQVVGGVSTTAGSTDLEEWSTGRVVLPRTGTYLLRLSNPWTDHAGRPYRFRVSEVNRAPETGSARIAVGAVAGDSIDHVGDVDEFTFPGRAGQELSLLAQLVSGMSNELTVELLRGGAPIATLRAREPNASIDDWGTGRIALPADGEYMVRVSGPAAGARARVTGRYRFELYPVDRRPEAGGPATLDGGAVSSAIERPGDVDEFTFAGTAGQIVMATIRGAAASRGYFMLELLGPDGAVKASAASTGEYVSYTTFTLTQTGSHALRISGLPRAAGSPSYGGYAAEAYSINPAPEHVPATLQVGQTITGEVIDRPGDIDVFTFRGEAGRVVNVFLGQPSTNGSVMGTLRPAGQTGPGGHPVYPGTPSLDGQSTGRYTLEAITYELRVSSAAHNTAVPQAPYGLRIFPIDRRPEQRPATYVLGETVSGEPLYPAGDIDEYTFQLSAPTRLRIVWQSVSDGPSGSVFAKLNDERGAQQWNSLVVGNDGLQREITLPAGRYTLIILNGSAEAWTGVGSERIATLPYTFSFTPY